MKRVAVSPRVIWPVVFLLIIAQAVFVAGYISHERTIYFWDHAMYFDMARQAYAIFTQSFSNGVAAFQASLADNYNLIYALPLFVTFSLFGISRMVFIVTNFLVFFLLYEIAVAFLLRRALGFGWGTALIVSLVAASLTPPLWLPLLEGYPDNGAAACLVFAAAIGWNGTKPGRMIWRAIGVGVLLGLAVLLRRHFVYPAFALLAALGCLEIWPIIRERKDRWKNFRRAIGYFLICGIVFAATLWIVAPDFVAAALTINYSQLYISYKKPALVFLYFLFGGFGFGLLLIAFSGLIILMRRSEGERKLAVFVSLFVLFWLIVWCLGPDQMGHHYVLHALPLLIAVGLSGWFVCFAELPKAKKYMAVALGLFLVANSAWALWLSPKGVWPNDNGTPGLLSAARPPVVRPDYDEWHRLAAYLVRTTKSDDKIMMVGSSFVLNLDLMHSVLADLGAGNMIARFPKNPEIDHEEPAPFDAFAGSNVYIVPTPPQYHLASENQRVISAAANQFPPPPSRAGMFHADSEGFHLADGVTVKIWRRDPWAPAALHDALADIRRDGPQDDNFNQGWAAIGLALRQRIVTNDDNVTAASGLFDPEHHDLRLFFDYPLEAGSYRAVFSYATDCSEPKFRLKTLTSAGKQDQMKDIPGVARRPDMVTKPFDVPAAKDGRFLELDFSSAPAALCRVELQGLRVEKNP